MVTASSIRVWEIEKILFILTIFKLEDEIAKYAPNIELIVNSKSAKSKPNRTNKFNE